MSEKSINFGDKKINKSHFYKNKKLFKIEDTDVDKILVSKEESYVTKIRLNTSLNIMMMKLPQMIGYVKHFDSNKTMSFKVIDNKLLKKYTKIWERVSNLMDKKFDSEPVYSDNNKYIKRKIKSYGDKINTNFQDNEIPKENASYKCLSLIMLESFITANKKYYP